VKRKVVDILQEATFILLVCFFVLIIQKGEKGYRKGHQEIGAALV
jgi:preprotein translocase subunit SecG